ncbi:platelet-activating factor acetylhydrolase IB subunit alpha [Microdochium nivale]|nr:platelet-activating factor acetylhydrolase IB subunit alpha [Microdochium nivale]
MSRLLTARQAEELHRSIVSYLEASNLPETAAAMRAELGLDQASFDPATTKKYETLLEKKWTSVVRLQKKIMDLESDNVSLRNELDSVAATPLFKRKQDSKSWLPSSPARHSLKSHRSPINCVAFHPVFSSIASGDQESTIKIWDWELGELEKTLKGHTKSVTGVDYGGPAGNSLLASCSSDLTIKLWDPADGYRNIRTLSGHDHTVSAVRFISSGAFGAASGTLLVSASRDQTLRIWDVTTGYCLKTLRAHADWVRDVSPSFDGRFLLSTGNDRTIRLWDMSSANPDVKVTMMGHENVVECCAFAPPSSYEHLATLAGYKKPPAATSSAEFMATGSRDKTIKIWDARGTCIKTLVGHDNWVRALLFHPGGKYLVSVADDKSIRCWDLSQEGKCVKTLSDAHEHFITCIRWAPLKESTSAAAASTAPANGENGSTPSKPAAAGSTAEAQTPCVLVTGSVDMVLKVFAN